MTRFLSPTASFFLTVLALGTLVQPALADHHEESRPAATSRSAPDTLELTDGRTLRGEVLAEDDEFVTFRLDGITRAYSRSAVRSIVKGERLPEPPPDAAAPTSKKAAKAAAKGKFDRSAPLGEHASAWLTDLVRRSDLDDPQVARGLRAAVGSLGMPAVAVLEGMLPAATPQQRKHIEGLVAMLTQQDAKRRAKAAAKRGAKSKQGATTDRAPGDTMDPPTDAPGKRKDKRRGDFRAQMERLSEELGLTAEQRPQVMKLIGDSQRAQYQLLRSARKDGVPAADLLPQLEDARTQLVSAVGAHLDTDQQALFATWADRYFSGLQRRLTKTGKKKQKQPD